MELVPGSREVSRYAIQMSLTTDREEERALKRQVLEIGVQAAAVDLGGELISSIPKLIERSVVAARREGVIINSHLEEGAVAGAAREAIAQITTKALGFNVGGKIGIARYKEHVAVSVFIGIGMIHLNEVAIGLGHRAI